MIELESGLPRGADNISVLQGFDAVSYLFDRYGPEFPEIAGLWGDFYYTDLYEGVPNAGDPGAWYDWRRAVEWSLLESAVDDGNTPQAAPRIRSELETDLPAAEDRITLEQSFSALTRLLQQYSYFREVEEMLHEFETIEVDDAQSSATNRGWDQWRQAVRAALDDPLAKDGESRA